MVKVLIAATAAPHKADESHHWLLNATDLHVGDNVEVTWFLACEDYPGAANPYNARLDPVVAAVQGLGGTVWRFSIDDGSDVIDSGNRIVRICTGRNLAIEYALRHNFDFICFLDTDIVVPNDLLPKLLELHHPYVGLNVPSYGLSGPRVMAYPREWHVQEHMNTAGCWMVHKNIFRKIGFHWDPQNALTDDPATHRDITELLKVPMYVRHDTPAKHVPALVPFEERNIDRAVRPLGSLRRPICVVMPALFADHELVTYTTEAVAALLNEDVERIYLCCNGGGVASSPRRAFTHLASVTAERLYVIDADGWRFHEMWNAGWRQALNDYGSEVLVWFVNNDTTWSVNTARVLGDVLEANDSLWAVYPDYDMPADLDVALDVTSEYKFRVTTGTYRSGGMCGWSFMIKAGAANAGLGYFDENLNIWGGDDDLTFNINKCGYEIGRVYGVGVNHAGSASTPYRPDLEALRDEDMAYLKSKWGTI